MNYQACYNQLILIAQSRTELGGYVEKHHIIPRSMGGSNDAHNIVSLTIREHYLAHILLWKIHRNRPTASAVWMMTNSSRCNAFKISGRRYERFRLEYIKNIKDRIPHNIDNKIYEFVNIFSNGHFTGTRAEFIKLYNIQPYALINRKKVINGWKLTDSIQKSQPNRFLIYDFINIDTGEEFKGTCIEFNLKTKNKISHVHQNTGKIFNRWKFRDDKVSKLTLARLSVYTFFNITTNQIIVGTNSDFKQITNINGATISSGRKQLFGWKIIDTKLPEYIKQ